MAYMHYRTQPKIAGGGAVRDSEGHPAAAADLASEKGHLSTKRAERQKRFFSMITGGQLPPPLGTRGPDMK